MCLHAEKDGKVESKMLYSFLKYVPVYFLIPKRLPSVSINFENEAILDENEVYKRAQFNLRLTPMCVLLRLYKYLVSGWLNHSK